MSIERWSDQIVLVTLRPEPEFSEDLAALRDELRERPGHVVLDFEAVSQLNSSNLAQLLRVRKQCIEHALKLKLAAMSDKLWSVMSVTGLDRIFEFAEDTPTALAAIQMGEGASGA